MNHRAVKHLMILAALSLLMSCGIAEDDKSIPSSGIPLIIAEMNSFPTGSVPPGFNNGTVTVSIVDSSSGVTFANATAIVNGVALLYHDADKRYTGNVVVEPGNPIVLSITVSGSTYTTTTAQYSSCPTILSPAPNAAWSAASENTVTWTGGSPTTNAVYGLGLLDADNPNSNVVWPADNSLHKVSIGVTSYSIRANSLTTGSRYVIVGIAAFVPISGAAVGSGFNVGGFNYVPVTVTM